MLSRPAALATVILLLAPCIAGSAAADRPLRECEKARNAARPRASAPLETVQINAAQPIQREQLSGFVREQIQAWAPKNASVEVKPWCFVESQTVNSRGITGQGAIAFRVKLQAPGARRLGYWLTGDSNMKVIAGVNSQGQFEIFGAEGKTTPARFCRALGVTKQLGKELLLDEKARASIIAGAAGIVAAPVTKGMTLALAGYALSEVGKSLQKGRALQRESLDATVSWAAKRLEQDKVFPSFEEAYNHYNVELDDRTVNPDGNLVGCSPWTRVKFYDRLRDLGL